MIREAVDGTGLMINPFMGGVTDSQLLDDALVNSDKYASFWLQEYRRREDVIVEYADDTQEYNRLDYLNAIKSYATAKRLSVLANELHENVISLQESVTDYSGVSTMYRKATEVINHYKALYKAADTFGI